MEEPCFGVETRAACIVRDLHLGAQLDEGIERFDLGRTHIRRREESKLARMTSREFFELGFDDANARPLHERHDDVDSCRGRQLAANLVSDRQVARTVNE